MRYRLRMLWGAIPVGLLLAVAVVFPASAGVNDFRISSFVADYYLSQDAQKVSHLHVEEVIEADFPSSDQNHGILRAIPQMYKGHPVHPEVVAVTQANGIAWPYTSDKENDNLVLKIGDAEHYVHGMQTYRISYDLDNVTSNYDDHDELFWDVNGDQWQQPFGVVRARLHVPADLQKALQPQSRCFVGMNGSQDQACTVAVAPQPDKTMVVDIAASRALGSGETLTFVSGFTKDTFAMYHKPLSETVRLIVFIFVGGILPPLVALGVWWRNWRRSGRDPRGRGTIIPEYLPPKEVSVLGAQWILRDDFQPMAMTAQIIDLAVRRYLTIYEVALPDSKLMQRFRRKTPAYEIVLTRLPEGMYPEERKVIRLLFGASPKVGTRVRLDELGKKLSSQAAEVAQAVSRRLTNEGYFVREPKAARLPYTVAGFVLLFLGFIGMPFTLGISVAGVILFVLGRYMPARTAKGVTLREYLLGIKLYMQVAETERIKVLQSPHGALTEKIDTNDKTQMIKLYEKLLPYAILFGIEKEWVKEFASLYNKSPEWYHSSNMAAFNTGYFVGSLQGFTAASATTFAPPSSASGSGFSGGGAGGGGGGGGGGGW